MTSPSPTSSRETSASAASSVSPVVPAVDGLRGLSALLVAIFHCWVFTDARLGDGNFRALIAAFGRGVDFFFVISGFVLFLPVVLRDGSFGDVRAYLVRRIARIVPAYYVSLFVQVFTVRWLTGFPLPFTTLGGWIVIVAHLLFLQHELPASLARAAGFWGNVMGFGVNGVVWSLSVEALFYVTLPLVAASFFRRPVRAVAIAVTASLVWRAIALNAPALVATTANTAAAPRLLDQYPAYFGHFAFGMSAAMVYVRAMRARAWRLPPAATSVLAVALVALLAWSLVEHGHGIGRSLTYVEQYVYASFNYAPVNPPLAPANPGNPNILDVNRWQPLTLNNAIDQNGNPIPSTQIFQSPEWGKVQPFALTEADKKVNVRNGVEYWVYHDPGPPPELDTANGGGTSDIMRWGYSMVSAWQSHLTPSDTVMWDISPASIGNVQNYPQTPDEYPAFYDFVNGGDSGTGRAVNPKTGQPYEPQIVPRADYTRALAEFWADGPNSETPKRRTRSFSSNTV